MVAPPPETLSFSALFRSLHADVLLLELGAGLI